MDNLESAVRAVAYFDVRNGKIDSSEVHHGWFDPLDEDEYVIDNDNGILTLKNSLQSNYVLAVAYMTKSGDKIGDIDKEFIADSSVEYKLKLIAPQQKDLVYDSVKFTTMDLELKNAYRIGRGKVDYIRLFDPNKPQGNDYVDKQGDEPFIYVLGLASSSKDKTKYTIDTYQWLINFDAGILRFPDLYPFAPKLNRKVRNQRERINAFFKLDRGDLELDSSYQLPELYTTSTITQDIREEAKLKIEYVGAATRSRTVNLGQTGITNVHVMLGNEELKENKDYIVNSELGQITFISDEVMNRATDKLTIDYEYEPLFKIEQTTLLGTAATYNFSEDFKLGGTFLYRSEKTIDKKPRLGSEPTRNIVFDVYLNYKKESDILTDIINFLPFYYSEKPSSIMFQGEVAASMPDHNVSKYKAAYIDDFESVRSPEDLGTYKNNWFRSSPPAMVNKFERGRIIWFNITTPVSYSSIWPNKEVYRNDDRLYPLQLWYIPDTGAVLPEASWDGIMHPLWNPDHTRSKYIEVWLKGYGVDLYIDLGQISEDVNGDGPPMRFEDKDNNGSLSEDEDVGLWSDPSDPFYDPYDDWSVWKKWIESHKNNFYNIEMLKYINGTKNNMNDPSAGYMPNTEDLNRNSVLDIENNYFEYKVRITKPDPANPGYYVPGTESDKNSDNPWRLYRIPLNDYILKVGNPSFNKIESVRLWVTGADTVVALQIAKIEIVENKWLENGIKKGNVKILPDSSILPPVDSNKESYRISVVNVEENADYVLPPDIDREIDPATQVKQNEQSLSLIYNNLEYGHEISARQIFTKTLDFTLYNILEFYVHGDNDLRDSLYFFIRIGTDENNFYQYSDKLEPGWEKIKIPLQDLMLFKKDSLLFLETLQERAKNDSTYVLSPEDSIKFANPMFYYKNLHIKGRPSLSNIRRIELGIVNVNPERNKAASGTVWFNELRLINPNNKRGFGQRFSISTNLADLGSFSYDVKQQDAFFHDLRSKFGKNNFTSSDFFKAKIDIGKLLPDNLGISIPINYSSSFSSNIPRMIPGSDIILGDSKSEVESIPELDFYKGISKSSNFSISFSKSQNKNRRFSRFSSNRNKQRSKQSALNPLRFLNFLLERLKLSYSRKYSNSEDYTNLFNRSVNVVSNASLDLSPPNVPKFKIFKWTKPIPIINILLEKSEFTFLPSQLSASVAYSENYSKRQRRFDKEPILNLKRYLDSDFKFGIAIFNSIPLNYSFTSKRDLKFDPLTYYSLNEGNIGYELNRNQSINFNYQPKIVSWLTPSFNYTFNYNHTQPEKNVQENIGQQVQQNEFENSINVSLTRNTRSSLSFNLMRFLDSGFKNIGLGDFIVWKFLKKAVFQRIGAISVNYSTNDTYSYGQLFNKPDLKYQLGLMGVDRPEPKPDTAIYKGYQDRDNIRNKITQGVSTSLNFSSFLRGNLGYSESFSEGISQGKSQGESKNKSFKWGLQASNLNRIPLLSSIFSNMSISHNGTFSVDSSTTRNSKSLNFAPVCGLSATLGRKVNLSYNFNNSYRESEATNGNITYTVNNTQTFNLSYSFTAKRGFRLNFLFLKDKTFKLQNSMNLDLRINYSHQKTWTGDSAPTQDVIDFSINPQISYNFSRNVTGGLTLQYSRNKNNKMHQTRIIKGVKFFAELRF